MTAELYINGINIPMITQPQGLEEFKMSLIRDTVYSGIDTNLDIEVKFYCQSGKNEIDLEYQSKGLDSDIYLLITDSCGESSKEFRFALDFDPYQSNDDYTTAKLVQYDDLSSGIKNWKENLKTPVNLTQISGLEADLYVRNLPLAYIYNADNIEVKEELSNVRQDLIWPPLPTFVIDWFWILPKADISINELENGVELRYNTIIGGEGITERLGNNNVISASNGFFATNINNNPLCNIEPEALFENVLDDGSLEIITDGKDGITLYLENTSHSFEVARMKEVFIIGNDYFKPRIVVERHIFGDPTKGALVTNLTPITSYSEFYYNTGITYTNDMSSEYTSFTGNPLQIKKNEKLWVYYGVLSGGLSVASPITVNGVTYSTGTVLRFINYQKIDLKINRNLYVKFSIDKNAASALTPPLTLANIEPYHTKVKAYQGVYTFNEIFKTDANFCTLPCFEDIWITDGQRMRNKINRSDLIVKPEDIFNQLERITCCGLGVNYYSGGNAELVLGDVYYFYSDNLVYEFEEGRIANFKISNLTSNYYNEVKVGFTNFKDNELDYCKTNEYNIENKGKSVYNKISDWIASKYIITRAMKLSSEDKDLEFDRDIFLLSSKGDAQDPSSINVTLSETSGIVADDMFVNPNELGLNRRYASVMNLFRHLYKWGFSLFANKTELKANKYEGNAKYNGEIRNTTGSPTNPIYQGLSECKLPMDFIPIDKTITGLYTDTNGTFDGLINEGIYIPQSLEFEVYDMTTIDLLNFRPNQYGLFKVTNGGVEYYGNLMSAVHDNGVTKFNLLRRFKNGI